MPPTASPRLRHAVASRAVTHDDPAELLSRADRYLHAVPLSGARAHEVGRFTLFRSTTAWSYYARPRPRPADARSGDVSTDLFTVEDVKKLRMRCHELGLPLNLEWVYQCAPSLARAAVAAGLDVVEHPLLALHPEAFVSAAAPAGATVQIAESDRQTLMSARAVADIAFSTPGTQVGEPGAEARDFRTPTVGTARADALVERGRRGVTVTAVALGPDGLPVSSGQHQPVGSCSEIVAVATLPAFRRRGLASAVTSALVENAFDNRVDMIFLMAQNNEVARIYERLGFRVIGTVGAAQPRIAKL